MQVCVPVDIDIVSDTPSSISSIPFRSSLLQKPASAQNGAPLSLLILCRNRFHSDKICDISYANIQGKECLIEKFRNSCVMDEDPSYRPKIFQSGGPFMGHEQESRLTPDAADLDSLNPTTQGGNCDPLHVLVKLVFPPQS
jgi:RNA recognition motif 2